MQSYANNGSTSNAAAGPSGVSGYSLGGAASSGGSNGRLGRLGKDDAEMGRYRDRYDESLNPFEAFKGRVSTKTDRYMFSDSCSRKAGCFYRKRSGLLQHSTRLTGESSRSLEQS
jgi:hypothetical protein